ncbi:MAG: diaminopimelate dehydrogenase [Clostridiales bacterium]|nr:diaminopimelate dehydrogenase [Clostridiales bacterium]
MQKIRLGIVGYGNIGRGVAQAVRMNDDMELVGIFSRRDPASVKLDAADVGTPVYAAADAEKFQDDIDVMILCGGSATDLPEQGPAYAKLFNTVDSFDTHAKIPEYFPKVDAAAKEAGHLSLISCGWDPGLFSMMRILSGACLPQGEVYTFWGDGVSQGHSDAIRRVPGVRHAVQYTRPYPEALDAVRTGDCPNLTTRQKHYRECFVVAEDGADTDAIEQAIVTMPNYFDEYNTIVHFITMEELLRDHGTMPHGGFVFRSGKTDENNKAIVEFSLKLDSNPQFTASVLVTFARAVYRMAKEGNTGAVSVFDIPLRYLCTLSYEEQRAKLL